MPRTMQAPDAVYGVTMQGPGVSTIVGVRLGEHHEDGSQVEQLAGKAARRQDEKSSEVEEAVQA